MKTLFFKPEAATLENVSRSPLSSSKIEPGHFIVKVKGTYENKEHKSKNISMLTRFSFFPR